MTTAPTTSPATTPLPDHVGVLVVGAGFGGLGLAARLLEAGIDDVLVVERTADLGGTWSRNTYPGAACDVPSTLYSYSFAPHPGWTRKYSTQPEILAYLRRFATDRGVTDRLALSTTVTGARFDEQSRRWRVATDRCSLTADVLVSAVGAFAEAKRPDLPGLDTFEGRVVHTLHWPDDLDLTGRRVAVVGTGATAVQLVPELADVAAEVSVVQRTPPWIVPRLDRRIGAVEQRLLRRVPLLRRATRAGWYAAIESFGLPGFVHAGLRHPYEALGRWQLHRQVRDPELRRRLTPDYMIGCKRAIFSDSYYPALARPHVHLVTSPLRGADAAGLLTDEGRIDVDTIVLATGFTALPGLTETVVGTHGRSIADVYRDRPQSYLGVANAGFPNMFTVLGPFGAAGNQSATVMIEAQIGYIVDALRRVRRDGVVRFEVRAEEQAAFVDEMHARAGRGTWLTGGCASYYTDGRGHNAGLYPGWSFEYRARTRRWDVERYDVSTELGAPTADDTTADVAAVHA